MRRRSLMLTAPRRLEWIEDELPPLQPDELLVETRAGAISIGSEVPIYAGTERSAVPSFFPRMTGYESVGRVLAQGAAVRRFRPGDTVVATYGHRTHAIVREDRAIAVPEGIGDDLALLAILSCDVAKGIGKVTPASDEPVLVTGAGTIGLLVVWTLAARGLRLVDVVEPQPARRALALKLGARVALPPDAAPPDAGRYAVGIECSSRNAAFALLQESLAPNGRTCILADGNVEPLALTPAFHAKELTVAGSSDGLDYHAHAEWFFSTARDDQGGLTALFDRQVESAELAQTFERLTTEVAAAIKVLVRYRSGSS